MHCSSISYFPPYQVCCKVGERWSTKKICAASVKQDSTQIRSRVGNCITKRSKKLEVDTEGFENFQEKARLTVVDCSESLIPELGLNYIVRTYCREY